ncbi:dihydroorotate dehydrogenase electron transfer subunit [Heliorestis acidaminivorans]|uniref:Dihydroorotate dehydrogenase B (NAD(+)), electron transfer subunit n=1 Tax=Heliorestis acidaminivorans TaxID=553427 RepID=A0A6I0EUN6_9FIRM|nr:dihydroorotate dehydrogenase electron transfer subunit [Heliorestis acidaminivorans]KAB2954485.1 dihydroorotate dehydrogenase electron transfer subunit [Heliorestis acidaminivorans]
MQPILYHATVLEQEELKPAIFRIRFMAPELARLCQPGQFIQVRVNAMVDPLLPRPISIHDFDSEAGTVTLLYHRVGKGTAILAQCQPGEQVMIWGPLGRGWTLPEAQDLPAGDLLPIYVAGGIGVAPLLSLAKAWSKVGKPGILLCGGRCEEQLVALEEFQALGVDVDLATEDGSAGHCGRVTALFDHLPLLGKMPLLYTCGPKGMLKAIHELALQKGWPCQVSLEERMCCGLGACLSCVCKREASQEGKTWTHAKVCTDGPVFWSKEVIWDD